MPRKKNALPPKKKPESSPPEPKTDNWRSKAIAPTTWVETLLSASRSTPKEHARTLPNDEATAVLIEFRSGRRGSAMLVDSLPFVTVGIDATDTIMPLAAECWDHAKEKRAEIDDDRRYDARIKVVETDDTGATTVTATSEWVEVEEEMGRGPADDVWDDVPASRGSSEAWAVARILGSQNDKLFRANISLVRAAGWLLRESIAGAGDRMNNEFATMQKVRDISGELIDARMEFAKQEADTQEVAEFGHTARHWMGLMHESKLAEKGIDPPDIPDTRAGAAAALYQSLTMMQVEKLSELLGKDKSELLLGVLGNAKDMSDADVEQVIAGMGSGMTGGFEFATIAEQIFSTDYVMGPHAIWQTRCARVLFEGPEEKAA